MPGRLSHDPDDQFRQNRLLVAMSAQELAIGLAARQKGFVEMLQAEPGRGGGGADGEPVLPLMCLIPGSIQPIDPPEIYKLTQTACTLQADEQDGQLVCKETQPGADGPAAPLLERSTELCTAAELVSRLPLREWAGTSTEACCCYGNVRVSQRPGAPTTRNPPTRLPTLHGTHPSSACRKTHACTATESGSSACLPACLPAVAAPHDPN